MNYLAIDVGGTYTKYAIISEECKILKKGKRPTILDPLEEFMDSLVQIYKEIREEFEISGIALSMPGMIDSKQGFMYTGGSLRCISNLNIVEVLEAKCNIPVTVENDAKCAAFAELWQGSLKDCQNAVVLVCGTGVGGAVIRNREVINGEHFQAGEFSYVLTESELDFNMDNCLGKVGGVPALLDYVSEETDILAEQLDGEKIFSMANSGDERAIAGIRKYVKRIATHIHNCHYILDPERFAVGGGISVQPLFLQMIKEELKKINDGIPWELPMPEVVVCEFFNDANLIGAVYVHLKSKEKLIRLAKVQELINMAGSRREAEYLRELLMD